jgi:hypothetical protein
MQMVRKYKRKELKDLKRSKLKEVNQESRGN